MTQQPAPTITENDINRIIRRDYPGDQYSVAMEVLNAYGKEEYHREQNRVRMAALKLSAGDIVKLKEYTNIAMGDYRDVLAFAEYPNYMKEKDIQSSSSEHRKAIIDKDWKQYCDWLNSR